MESSKNDEGIRHICARDWDAEAMRIVLSILHNRTKSIPGTVSLELLCRISVIVDYYQLQDAIHFFATKWIDPLRSSLPSVWGRDLLMWLCVSNVFRDKGSFKAVTRTVVQHAPSEIPSLGLPISQDILDEGPSSS
jgi:hypothetical protein